MAQPARAAAAMDITAWVKFASRARSWTGENGDLGGTWPGREKGGALAGSEEEDCHQQSNDVPRARIE